MVPLVVSMTIFNTAPFWTFLIGWIVLREAMSWFEIIALVLSFGGIILIAFAKQDARSFNDFNLEDSKILLGSGCLLITALLYATTSI